MMDTKLTSFWSWLISGSGGKPGYRRLLNRWLIGHVLMGLLLALIVKVDLATAANTVLLPLVGILIGLCFAWAGNAQALLQTSELEKFTEYREGGFPEYIYTYQLAIFTILITLVAWAVAGFRVFDDTWPMVCRKSPYFAVKTLLFALSSMTLRECWHVVLGAQWMLLIHHEISMSKRKTKRDE